MRLEYDYEWIPISKEEYEASIYHAKDSSLLEIITESFKNSSFRKDPIYRNPGINAIINNDIIDYKYYKKGNPRVVTICSEREYDTIIKEITKG